MNCFPNPNNHQYQYITRFNQLWKDKKITKPLVILVGGYAGVGKSTLACAVSKFVNDFGFFATGFARAAAQTFISIEQNPALYKSTFKLHELLKKNEDENQVIELFKQQRAPITETLVKSLNFIANEKQHTIIDGNHVSPDLSRHIKNNNPGIIPIEVYLSVTDQVVHRQMMQGSTHNRTISDLDFKTARILHDFLVTEAKQNQKHVYEFSEGIVQTIRIIDQELGKIIASK